MIRSKNRVMPNQEKSANSGERRFETTSILWARYNDIKNSSAAKRCATQRKKILTNYERKNEKRKIGKKEIIEPNFGGFQSRVDSLAQKIFDISTERAHLFNIRLIEMPDGMPPSDKKDIEERLRDKWHECILGHHPESVIENEEDASDIAKFGKTVRHWPINTSGIFPEAVDIDKIYPNSRARCSSSTWDYCFVEKDLTLHELKRIRNNQSVKSAGWNLEMLDHIIDDPASLDTRERGEEADIRRGEKIPSDYVITIVYAYVKEYSTGKIALYCFPAESVFYKKGRQHSGVRDFLRYLPEAANKMEDLFCVRGYKLNTPYWRVNSYAKQIYSSMASHNKTFNLLIRAAVRNSIMWISGNESTRKTLEASDSSEIQFLGQNEQIAQTRLRSDIGELSNVMRSLVAENDSNFSFGTSSGPSQVTEKGYPVTAEEASLSFGERSKGVAVLLKSIFSADISLVTSLFFGPFDKKHLNGKEGNSAKAFVDYASKIIPLEYISRDNVTVSPVYNMSLASPQAREQASRGLIAALSINPLTPGQEKAQRELVGALVGSNNVDYYLARTEFVLELQRKVGAENEDMDNPALNRSNIPVLPNDKHLLEIPIHLADYEVKLQTALSIIDAANGVSPIQQVVLYHYAKNIIIAQDNKGGHIQAHIDAVAASGDDKGKAILRQIEAKFSELRKNQDDLQANIEQKLSELDDQMKSSSISDFEFEHKKRMLDLEFDAASRKSDLALTQAVEKKEVASASRKEKLNASLAASDTKRADLAAESASRREKIGMEKEKAAIDVAKNRLKIEAQKNERGNRDKGS